MKIVSFILLIFFVTSCIKPKELPSNSKIIKISPYNVGGIMQTIEYDSCEYILYTHAMNTGFGAGLTHKGNCKYCKDRNLNKY
jgi:hypothetical protein